MKRNIFIFHGTGGNPEENWFPWLKERLERKGHQVFVPQFPLPENDSLETRLKVLEKYNKYIDANTILIGHSRGGLFLFRVLERLKDPVYASFLVSASIGIKPYVLYRESYKFSNGYKFDWDVIRSHSKKFFVYHSDNDPYTSLKNGKAIANHLMVKLTCISNAGHFNRASGYTKFEKLFQDILSVL
ncbi:MAG TPA: alpha/beta hydrolase [Patescibacteria group bacterium]|nr:alpha/beta hydrolase [Patescibacteria group bacterium]